MNLSDEGLIDAVRRTGEPLFQLWEPRDVWVVLGRSSDPQKEVRLDLCHADGVPVLRRRGGGASVVLGPRMIVTSIGIPAPFRNSPVEELRFWTLEQARALDSLGVLGTAIRGTSDLCIGDRKILGSTLYRSRAAAPYQSSLLVDFHLDLLSLYLLMPPRMPDYRRGRPHTDFVTTLKEQGHALSPSLIIQRLENAFIACGARPASALITREDAA
jgi:lipoate-protein ligase A